MSILWMTKALLRITKLILLMKTFQTIKMKHKARRKEVSQKDITSNWKAVHLSIKACFLLKIRLLVHGRIQMPLIILILFNPLFKLN